MSDFRDKIFYVGKDGEYYTRGQIETAFFLTTGIKYSESTRIDFMQFLERIWGKSIVSSSRPDMMELVAAGRILDAVKVLKENSGMSIKDCYEAVKKMQSDMDDSMEMKFEEEAL